eukprot:10246714-Ditylum_brightwellii.AAC.1
MLTFSQPINGDKFQGKYSMYNLHMVPYNTNSPTYNLCHGSTIFDSGTIEEWLKFYQNFSTLIKG